MSTNIKVYFDYVCPFCYLTKFPFAKAIEGKDVTVEYIPFELRRSPTPKVDPMHDADRLERFETVIQPIVKELGIAMNLPEISPHPYSTRAFQGFCYAKEHGKAEEYNMLVFHRFYVEEQDIGEMAVLERIMEEIGLDISVFREIVQNETYSETLWQTKLQAKEQGITSIPTIFIGNQKLQGFHRQEEYELALEKADESQQAAQDGMRCDGDGPCAI